MKNTRCLLVLLLLWTCAAFGAEGTCPQWEGDSPCICDEAKQGVMVQCMGPAPESEVVSALDRITASEPWDLQLDSLELDVLPETVRTASSLRLVNCKLGRLQRTTPSVWPNLNEVVFESVKMRENPWSQLRNARVLKSVKVSDFTMTRAMGLDFRRLPASVEYFDLRKTGTTKFEPGCMSHLKHLLYVFIADMPLSDFPRDALPPQLPQLHTFILGNTLVDKLEPDFFSGMPKLEVLMLNGNKFSSLDSQLFMPLRSHLTHLLAERNPLQCGCNLLWLKRNFQNKRAIKVMATCYDSSAEEYREVMTLNEEEYCT